MILAVIAATKAFEGNHPDEEDLMDQINTHAQVFTLWAWGVGATKIDETRFDVEPDDAELRSYQTERHKHCILSSLSDAAKEASVGRDQDAGIWKQLNENMSRQSEELQVANELRREDLNLAKQREELKRDRLKGDLHPRVRKMILNASSVCKERKAPEPTKSCRDFFNKKNQALADQELNAQFDDLRMKQVGFAHGTVQSLYGGAFMWGNPGSPSNFTPFALRKLEIAKLGSQKSRYLVLHIINTQCQGKTVDEAKKSAKQMIDAPMNILDLQNKITGFRGLAHNFFGKESELTERLEKLEELLDDHILAFETRQAGDELFAAKFLFAVDTRSQIWLKNCTVADDRSEVNDAIVNFRELVNDVILGRFNVILPATVQMKGEDLVEDGVHGEVASGLSNGKRKREDDNSSKKSITNTERVEGLELREGESWKDVFCGEASKERVRWNKSCFMCPRWFSRGFCFSDCHNKESHVSKSNLSEAKEKEYRGYLKRVRKEA